MRGGRAALPAGEPPLGTRPSPESAAGSPAGRAGAAEPTPAARSLAQLAGRARGASERGAPKKALPRGPAPLRRLQAKAGEGGPAEAPGRAALTSAARLQLAVVGEAAAGGLLDQEGARHGGRRVSRAAGRAGGLKRRPH